MLVSVTFQDIINVKSSGWGKFPAKIVVLAAHSPSPRNEAERHFQMEE